jgi:hypothetical protein
MTSPHPRLVLQVFERLCGDKRFWEELQPAGAAFCRRRIYSLAVVVRLMMVQRLLQGGSLSQAVQQFVQGRGGLGPGPDAVSLGTGAYCRARQKLPTLVAIQVLDAIVERLQGWLPSNPILPDRPVFVVDGSTLTLPHTAELRKAYPPCHNQHGQSHWPILRMVVLQDVQTGLALRPHWGPLNGPVAVSEQQLVLQAMDQLPSQAVVLGDRNFGVFGVAWAAHQQNHPVLLRLTRQRAQKIGSLTGPKDQSVVWRPTRWDRCGGPLDSPAALPGRLLAVTSVDPQQPEPFYFFTTLDLPAEQIFQLYRLRWNVETDLRSIKRTVQLQQLTGRSEAMLHKELYLAIAAYNLVRAVICLAAERIQVSPRRLSFTNVFTLLETFLPDLYAATTPTAWNTCWDRIIQLATSYILPKRTHPRSYPRYVWPKSSGFPFYKAPKLK